MLRQERGMVSLPGTRFLLDDNGQDLVEYALLSGIISIGSVLLLSLVTDAMRGAYVGWHTAAHTAWEPCPPAPAACP
jgi:Flp pilus assembly pilin Flp